MVINAVYNRYFGLGGSARHLHLKIHGGELASTGIQKSCFYSVKYRRKGLKKINANKKFVPANLKFESPAFAVAA